MNASSGAASAPEAPRRRLSAVVVAAVAVVLLGLAGGAYALLSSGGDGGGTPPAGAATRLVPAGALVYVHLSTDTGRRGTARAQTLAKRFAGFASARENLLTHLSAPGCKADVGAPRGGREAGLALLPGAGGTAGSLVLVDTGSTARQADRTCGTVRTAKIGRFLAVGQEQSIRDAEQLAAGRGRALADDPVYRRAVRGLPADRVLDAWATRDGVRRLLAPQSGLLGAAGVLLDRPGLRAAAAALTARDGGARLTVTSLQDSKRAAATPFKQFTPTLQSTAPADALGYLGLAGISGAAGRLLGLVGPGTAALAPLLKAAGKDLQPLLDVFTGEVGVTISAAVPAPTLTLVARARDEAATRARLRRVQAPLARLLGQRGKPVPRWRRRGDAFSLRPARGIELDYAVFDGKVVASTRLAGIDAVRRRAKRLPATANWRASIGNAPERVTSLVFLDFSQLLRLGERTGLNDSRAYLAVKHDLRKIKAVSALSTSAGDQSTAELFLSIP